MDTLGISDEAVEAALAKLPPIWASSPVYRANLIQALAAAAQLEPELKAEWGVRYDNGVDWVEQPDASEAWAKVMLEANKDCGAIALVRRQVSEWEVVDRG